MRSSRFSVASLLLSLVSVSASGQTAVPAFELERLTLNPAGQGGLVVGGGDLLPAGGARVSLTGHYEHDPLVFVGLDGTRLGSVVGSRVTTHLAGAWAPFSRLELGLQVPVVVWQGGTKDLTATGVTAVDAYALGTPWAQLRLGLLRQDDDQPLDVTLGAQVGLPIGSAAALTRDQGVSVIPHLGLGRSVQSKFRIAAELGAWVRPTQALSPTSSTAKDQLGTQVDIGLGLSTLGEGLRYEGSVRVAAPLTRTAVTTEVLFGVRAPVGPVELYGLAGPGFGNAPGTPAFRVLVGVAFPAPEVKKPAPPVVTPAPAPKPKPVVFVAPTPAPKPAPVPEVPKCVAGRPHDPAQCPDLDWDGDGIKNSADRCATVPGPIPAGGCPDADGDGVADLDDVCPALAGPRLTMGCPDQDQDGVLDGDDACPAVKGPRETKGCPDVDQDGVLDADDACPTVKGAAATKGCPDQDQDGVVDADDRCPAEAGPAATKGCPDQDKDGVGDADDNCKTEPGPAENQGCPVEKKQLVVITRDKLVIREKVFFDTAKSTIQSRSFGLLDQVAKILVEHADVQHVSVEGHTDSVGSADRNRTLSQARADAVVKYLVKKGVAPARLEAKGWGPDKPVAENSTPAGREQNRRVEFVIVGTEKTETKTMEVK